MVFKAIFSSSSDKKDSPEGYVIGVSSGMFSAAQPQEKISLIDLSQKGFYGAVKGVNFTQIDLETTSELHTPEIEKRLERIRNLGINYGFHGETPAMGGAQIALTSAIEDQYILGHERLINNLEGSGKVKGKYYLQHSCEGPPAETPYLRLGEHMQPTALVDFYGRRLYVFIDENPDILDWLVDQPELYECISVASPEMNSREAREGIIREVAKEKGLLEKLMTNRTTEEEIKNILEETDKRLPKIGRTYTKEQIKSRLRGSGMAWGTERVAYLAVGKWMSNNKDPLWKEIVGEKSLDGVKGNPMHWVPAVAAKYIWGHMNPISGSRFKDPKNVLEKYDFYFLLEPPMVSRGMEREFRFVRPKHIISLCKTCNTKYFRALIDFEHILGADIDPDEEISSLDIDEGKYVKGLHVGWPTPLQPAHVPIPLGSEQQEWLYRWAYALRKKGFDESENRYIIFERAGGVGGDAVDQSTLSLRKIVEFLRKEVEPNKLPLDFFGIEEGNMRMQETQIREHALDPIKGLISVPEVSYGFLSKAAIEKGKSKEWETEKYR